MSAATVVFGAWRLRHGEPVDADGARIELVPLRDIDLRARSLVLDAQDLGRAEVISPRRLPLAILAGEGGNARIAYLVHSLEAARAQFVRVEEHNPGRLPLYRRIASLFDNWHLRLNNNECFYVDGGAAEAIHAVTGEASYWQLGCALHERLDEGAFRPFVPQFRAPPRVCHVDVEAFALVAAGREGEGVVLAQRHGRRRSNWDQPLFTLETFVLDGDGSARRSRRGEIDLGSDGLDQAVADFAGAPARRLAAWRRLAFEVPCESLDSGNVFTVAVEDCQPLNGGPARRVLARVRYEKTRGHGETKAKADDLAHLSRCVTQCLTDAHVVLADGREMLSDAALTQRIEA